MGGSKVSSKIGVLEALMDKCDKILVGGGMIFTFSKPRPGRRQEPGGRRQAGTGQGAGGQGQSQGVELLLPTDVVLADNFAPDANSQTRL